MRCSCGEADMRLAGKGKRRPWRERAVPPTGRNDRAYLFYGKEMTYRGAFVCQP
jgi:hypothetical protein